MNNETKAIITDRIKNIVVELETAKVEFDKATETKAQAVRVFNACQEKIFLLNTEKLKLEEDLSIGK